MAAEETLLAAIATPLLAEARAQQAHTGEKVRLLAATLYQADSWPHPRRIDYKAEALAKGPTTRFVVTSRPAAPEALCDVSSARGTPELWIKDIKRACFADCLSAHRFWTNQFSSASSCMRPSTGSSTRYAAGSPPVAIRSATRYTALAPAQDRWPRP
jgi:Transposase DDE domain group 1